MRLAPNGQREKVCGGCITPIDAPLLTRRSALARADCVGVERRVNADGRCRPRLEDWRQDARGDSCMTCINCTPVRHLNCMTLSRSVCCWLGRVLGFRERWGECWRSIGAQPQAARARGLPRWRFRRWFSISPSALGLRRDRPSPGDRSRASRRSAAWACRRSTDGSGGRR